MPNYELTIEVEDITADEAERLLDDLFAAAAYVVGASSVSTRVPRRLPDEDEDVS